MENFDSQKYRKNLAEDLKSIPDHKERKDALDREKESFRYEKARSVHHEDIQEHIKRMEKLNRAEKALYFAHKEIFDIDILDETNPRKFWVCYGCAYNDYKRDKFQNIDLQNGEKASLFENYEIRSMLKMINWLSLNKDKIPKEYIGGDEWAFLVETILNKIDNSYPGFAEYFINKRGKLTSSGCIQTSTIEEKLADFFMEKGID